MVLQPTRKLCLLLEALTTVFLNLRQQMEVNGHCHALTTLASSKYLLVPICNKTGWVPDWDWMQ
jgi:hypothetical protein